MVREEEINNASYAQFCNNSSVTFILQKEAFKAGAEWADENPINVWHKSDEVPCDWSDIIVVDINLCMKTIDYKSGEFDGYSPIAWKNFADQHNIKIWAYCEDLIPYNFLELFND